MLKDTPEAPVAEESDVSGRETEQLVENESSDGAVSRDDRRVIPQAQNNLVRCQPTEVPSPVSTLPATVLL